MKKRKQNKTKIKGSYAIYFLKTSASKATKIKEGKLKTNY